jgi:hypothetical protein
MVATTKPRRWLPRVRKLDQFQWCELVDRAAQRELGISGEEFVRKLKAGEFGDADNDPRVMRLAMLLPSGW